MFSIKTISTALVLTTTLGVAGAAFAEPPRMHVMDRQLRQQARIQQGIRSGQLTPRETRRLEREQRRINRAKERMLRNDGRLGPRERMRLNRMQNRASRHIFNKKHNWRVRR